MDKRYKEMLMKNTKGMTLLVLAMMAVSAPAFAGVSTAPLPEPMSISLLAGGVLAIAAVRRMRRK